MVRLFHKENKGSVDLIDEVDTDISSIKGITTVLPPNEQDRPNYVNLHRIIKEHSRPVMEYLDNEISNLKQKIEKLEAERLLVSKLYQVIQNEETSS
jgi:hypothetical protein